MMPRVIVIGECRLEVEYSTRFEDGAKARPAGLMTDIALKLASRGFEVMFLTEAAVDCVGDTVIDYLASHGVDVSCVDRFTDGLTPVAVRNEGVAPTLYTSYPPADGFDIIWPRLDDKNDIVIFGDYMTLSKRWSHNFGNFISHVRGKGCPTIYVPGDISWRVSRVTKVMPQVFENLENSTAVMLDAATCNYYFGTPDPALALKQTVEYYCPSIIFADPSAGVSKVVGAPVPTSIATLLPVL